MSKTAVTNTRRPKSATRAAILQQAYEMYLSKELEPGNEKLALVLERLGYTTGAGYQIWQNQAEFRQELAIYVAENIEYASLAPITEEAIKLSERNLPFDEHVLHAGDLFVKIYLHRQDFFLSLRFFAMDDERPEVITSTLIDAYERSSWEVSNVLLMGIERFGRRLREPITIRDITAALTALLEGYALRARVEPGAVNDAIKWNDDEHHMFSIVFLSLMKEATEPN